MNGINEKIKHAETEEEIDRLLREGEAQLNATQRTLNRRVKIAEKRRLKLRQTQR
jgi:hypothetical protein